MRIRREIQLAETTIEQIKNDTFDEKSNTSKWLNDSYNLLFNNGRVRKPISETSFQPETTENDSQSENTFSFSSQNIDSFVEGESSLNTDRLSLTTHTSPENTMEVSICSEQKARKSRDESQRSSTTSLVNMSKKQTPPTSKKRGTSQDRIKSPVQVRTGAKLTKTTSLIDLSHCTNQKQPTSQQNFSPSEILYLDNLDEDEIIEFSPERTSTPYPDEKFQIPSDDE
jgi:hypothetical protein